MTSERGKACQGKSRNHGNGRLLFGVKTVQRRIVREGESKASFDDISKTYLV